MRKDIGTFRGKELDTGEWVMGYFDAAAPPGYAYIITGNEQTCRVDPETVGEFTGLTDKYGERIFEGDIVHLFGDKGTDTQFINYNALVVFRHGGFCAIDGTPDDYAVCRFDFTSTLNCEVISNIHDNPELIEDGD